MSEGRDPIRQAVVAYELDIQPGKFAQAAFESLFDHKPKIDNRTPAEVHAGLSIEDAAELHE